jgi:hypothetical protein
MHYDRGMRSFLPGVLVAVFAAGCPACGGNTVVEHTGCDAPTLANCPQDTIPDAAECPLPPVSGVQAFFTVGCMVTSACGGSTQVCTCASGTPGPKWGCASM